jgi:hypothetical protein
LANAEFEASHARFGGDCACPEPFRLKFDGFTSSSLTSSLASQ